MWYIIRLRLTQPSQLLENQISIILKWKPLGTIFRVVLYLGPFPRKNCVSIGMETDASPVLYSSASDCGVSYGLKLQLEDWGRTVGGNTLVNYCAVSLWKLTVHIYIHNIICEMQNDSQIQKEIISFATPNTLRAHRAP